MDKRQHIVVVEDEAAQRQLLLDYLSRQGFRVTGFDTPFPYSLEHEYMPNADRTLGAIRQTLEW